ncbi:MAG: protein kinase [Kineosporiaceae bacterium]
MIEAWQVLGERYELGEVLGTGGMAEVRRARDIRLGREVAIKLLRPEAARNEEIVTAFRAEAMASARLNHPGIVAVYDVGEAELAGVRRPYLVMEMIEGTPLSALLADGTSLTVERSIEIGVDVCAALAHAHERGVIHRDVTPSNLMIMPNGAVKVTDFGIARAVTEDADADTDAGRGYGSVAFISPEQARRRPVDARSDLYSFGCVLMTMLTGTPPFAGSPQAVVAAHVRTRASVPSDRRPGIDPAIDEVVLRCLAKDPWHRPQTAAELRRDLLRILVEFDAVAARSAAAGGLAAPEHEGYDVTELPTARVASGLLPDVPPDPEPDHPAPRALTAGPPRAALPAAMSGPVGDTGAGTPAAGGTTAPAAAAGEGSPGPPKGSPGARVTGEDGEGADRRVLGRRGWLLAAVVAVLAGLAALVWGLAQAPGASSVEVPATAGLTVREAERELDGVGLEVGSPIAEASRDIDVGLVIRTEPPAGETMTRGEEVALVISTGPAQVAVPEAEGLDVDEAREVLREAGLELGEIVASDSSLPRDRVIRSEPAFGELVVEGTPVSLVAASGSNVVPQARGLDEDEARRLLEDAGFEVEVQSDPESSEPVGTVLSVAPAAGVRQEVGTSVVLTVALPADAVGPTGVLGRSVLGTATVDPEPSAAATLTATVTETETVTRSP